MKMEFLYMKISIKLTLLFLLVGMATANVFGQSFMAGRFYFQSGEEFTLTPVAGGSLAKLPLSKEKVCGILPAAFVRSDDASIVCKNGKSIGLILPVTVGGGLFLGGVSFKVTPVNSSFVVLNDRPNANQINLTCPGACGVAGGKERASHTETIALSGQYQSEYPELTLCYCENR
jgi:hypothetical protein